MCRWCTDKLRPCGANENSSASLERRAWGVRFLPVSEELGVRARLLADGGADMWNAFMDELRERHLGRSAHAKKKAVLSVSGQLQRAVETAQARPHKRLMKVRGFDKSRPRAR